MPSDGPYEALAPYHAGAFLIGITALSDVAEARVTGNDTLSFELEVTPEGATAPIKASPLAIRSPAKKHGRA